MKYKRILAAILGALMMFSPTSQLFTYENNNSLIAEAAISDDTLRLSQKTITLSEANDEQIITFSAISQNDIKFDSVALHIKYDNRLELVPIEYNGTMVGAKPMQEYDEYRAQLSGYNELFLLSANNTPIIVTNSGTDLWQFKFKIKDTDSVRNGDKFDIKLEFYNGDFFALKRYGNFVISDIEQGYIAIRDSIVTTTKATTTTTKATTTTTKATTTTTKATTTTTKAATTTTKAATTTTKAATTTTTSNNKFTNGADNWSFSNSRKNFGNTYYINSEYWDKLMNGLTNKEKELIKENVKNAYWNGSCYGMATTSILASYGIMKPSNWQNSANFLNDIVGPPSNDVKSLINYYFSLQLTDVVQQRIAQNFYNENEKQKIEYLVSCLKDGSPTLLCYHGYFFGNPLNWSGHAVVAYDIEYGTYVKNGKAYNGKIITYDNNSIVYNDDYCLYFNTSDGSWTIPEYKLSASAGSILGLITDDLDLINYHGYINGTSTIKYEDYIAILQSTAIAGDYNIIKASYSNGIWANATTSDDDIKMFSSMIDDENNGNLKFALKDSNASYILNRTKLDQLDLSLSYENSLLKVKASSGSTAKFSPLDCVSVSGQNMNYDLNIVLNEEYKVTDWYSFTVNGSGVNEATLEKAEKGYILKATNLRNVSATAYNDDVTAKVTFSTEYPKVFLYEKDEHTIGIAVDTDDNGSYETEIEAVTLELGDINNDGHINAVDASTVLSYYAMISTNKNGDFDENQKAAADVDHDGKINAVDASNILSYYAYVSTTKEEVVPMEQFMKKTA